MACTSVLRPWASWQKPPIQSIRTCQTTDVAPRCPATPHRARALATFTLLMGPWMQRRCPSQTHMETGRTSATRVCATKISTAFIVAGDLAISLIIPSLEVVVLKSTCVYTPLWLIFGSVGTTGIFAEVKHGAVLAICWLISAAYARAYDKEALDGQDVPELLWRLFLAGFLNAWLIFFSVSFMGLLEPFSEGDTLRLGIPADVWGPAGFNVDVKVFRQVVDVNVDIVAEALLLNSWHIFCAGADVGEIWRLLLRRFVP